MAGVRTSNIHICFLKKQPGAFLEQLDSQQGRNMTQNGISFVPAVCQNTLILSESLLSNWLILFYIFLQTTVMHLLPLRVTGQLLQAQSICQAVLFLAVMNFYHSCLKTSVLNVQNKVVLNPLGTLELFYKLNSFYRLNL